MSSQNVPNDSSAQTQSYDFPPEFNGSRWEDMCDEWPADIRSDDLVRSPGADPASQVHDVGRCKPCAFFHTKGCQSGTSCTFCHLCPANEKQRRKRERKVRHHPAPAFEHRRRDVKPSSHVRQISIASAVSTAAPSQYNHSRIGSASTEAVSEFLDTDDEGTSYPIQHDQIASQSFAYSDPFMSEQMVGSYQAPMVEPLSCVIDGVQYAMVTVPVPVPQHDCNDYYRQAGQMYDGFGYDACWTDGQLAGMPMFEPAMTGSTMLDPTMTGPPMLEEAYW